MLPCKRCGYPHGRIINYALKNTSRISCPNCGYCTKEKSNEQDAVNAWNQRGGNRAVTSESTENPN